MIKVNSHLLNVIKYFFERKFNRGYNKYKSFVALQSYMVNGEERQHSNMNTSFLVDL